VVASEWESVLSTRLLPPGVNFINIYTRVFCTKFWHQSRNITRKADKKDVSYEKFVRLTLMKLTSGSGSAKLRQWICATPASETAKSLALAGSPKSGSFCSATRLTPNSFLRQIPRARASSLTEAFSPCAPSAAILMSASFNTSPWQTRWWRKRVWRSCWKDCLSSVLISRGRMWLLMGSSLCSGFVQVAKSRTIEVIVDRCIKNELPLSWKNWPFLKKF